MSEQRRSSYKPLPGQERRPDGSWGPAPWTFQRAHAFVMPFGKFKGKTIGEIDETEGGRGYLEWAADAIRGSPGTAARVYLSSVALGFGSIIDLTHAEEH
jgi:hypothetical protein